MNILQPIATVQNLVIIAREDAASVTLNITNEETDVLTTAVYSPTNSNGYMTIPVIYSFVEGGSYYFEVETIAGDLLYRGKIFTTAQTDIENYNINSDLLQA